MKYADELVNALTQADAWRRCWRRRRGTALGEHARERRVHWLRVALQYRAAARAR